MSPILVKLMIEGFVEHKYSVGILIFNFDPIISRGFSVDIIRKKPT
jgi:hypothetical protein